ncbi:MAG TPA: disulfide isomerase DsbC N-terminal domain-containing protein [Gammaproteobacteria bacterium]|nr:disulfide isomerase DsbC N-terminal domain-containing protein [Gammaproteobacteria bacterium]
MTSFILAASLVALFPAAAAEGASVEESLAARFPNIEVEDIRPSPVDGLWEIAVAAQQVAATWWT